MADSVSGRVTSCTNTTGLEVDLSFLKNVKEWITDIDEWNEDLFSYLDSYNISSEEDKLRFLKKLLKTVELEYEILLTNKNSQFVFLRLTFLMVSMKMCAWL